MCLTQPLTDSFALTDLWELFIDAVEEADALRSCVAPEGEERLDDLGVLEHHVIHVSADEEDEGVV